MKSCRPCPQPLGRSRLITFLFLALCLPVSSIASAQVGASVEGVVQDQTGAVIGNATVSITNGETGQIRESATDASGRYSLSDPLHEVSARLFAYVQTAEEGRYEIHTIRPLGLQQKVPHDGQKRYIPPHIRFELIAPGYRPLGFPMAFHDDPRMYDYWRNVWAKNKGAAVVLEQTVLLEPGEVVNLREDIQPNYDFYKSGPGYSAIGK